MGRDSFVPEFDGTDYAFWKSRMRAHLKSKGADVWAIVLDTNYPNTSSTREYHDANNKAVDLILGSLSRSEFDRVSELEVAHKIWTQLEKFH